MSSGIDGDGSAYKRAERGRRVALASLKTCRGCSRRQIPRVEVEANLILWRCRYCKRDNSHRAGEQP